MLDAIATDHAPHTWEEKQGDALTAASGAPSIQFSLMLMVELVRQGYFSMETLVERMCHAPATIYRIDRRGYIREGYYADLVLIDPTKTWVLTPTLILSSCGWSPYTGTTFHQAVHQTWLNGQLIYDKGTFTGKRAAMPLTFLS
jgi:dihydroorotase